MLNLILNSIVRLIKVLRSHSARAIAVICLVTPFAASAKKPLIIPISWSLHRPQNLTPEQINPFFGPEFNKSNWELFSGVITKEGVNIFDYYLEQMAQAVQRNCPTCGWDWVEDRGTHFRTVVVKGRQHYQISEDPKVIEIQRTKQTNDQILASQEEITKIVFTSGEEAGLFPVTYQAGHLHMDYLSAFDRDPVLYSNFIKDWFENSEMTFEIFKGSALNAPTVKQLGARNELALKAIFWQMDRFLQEIPNPSWIDWIRNRNSPPTSPNPMEGDTSNVGKLVNEKFPEMLRTFFSSYDDDLRGNAISRLNQFIQFAVYYPDLATRDERNFRAKNENLNLAHLETLEFRAVPEAQNAYDYYLLTKLIRGRLRHIAKNKEVIPFQGIKTTNRPEEAVQKYFKWAEEAGLTPEEALRLMRKDYHKYAVRLNLVNCRDVLK